MSVLTKVATGEEIHELLMRGVIAYEELIGCDYHKLGQWIDSLSHEVDDADKVIIDLEDNIDDLNEENWKLRDEIDDLYDRIRELEDDLAAVNQMLEL